MDNLKNRIAGSLIGGAIGDALGYQIEFKRNVKNKEIISFNNGTGIISDDTQMTLFTANALLFRETRACMRGIALLPVDAIYESYLDWLDTQNHTDNHHSISWIKNIKELNESRAPGNTCISALSSGIKGTIKQPINNSKGCDGIMRVAPIGLYMKKPELAGKFAAEASALTHGHPLGIIPSYVFSTLIWYLTNTNLTIREALDKSIKQYEEKFDIFDKENKNYFIELVNKAIKLSEEDKIDIDAYWGNDQDGIPTDQNVKLKVDFGKNRDLDFTDCSIHKLVELSKYNDSDPQSLGVAKYKYADFMYCKYLGKISNNHLITLRKFSHPIGDNIFAKPKPHADSMPADVGRLVTWFGTEDNKLEEICKYSMNATWKEFNSDLQDVESKEDNDKFLPSLINITNPQYLNNYNKTNYL